jgi:hypothetical protein
MEINKINQKLKTDERKSYTMCHTLQTRLIYHVVNMHHMPYAANMLSEQHREVYYDKYPAGINFKSERVGLKYLIKAVKGCDIVKVITMEIPFLAVTTNVHQLYSKTKLVQILVYDCGH